MLQNCYFIRTFIEIPSNSLFISSRKTRNQILNINLIIITTIIMMILIIIIIIIIMYFTTLEHLKARIKGEELLLPRHTVIWMCLWAKETLIWLSQKVELNRFHFHFCKLANNLTRFVNGRLRMRPIARAQEEYFFQKSSSTLYCLNYLHLHKGWSGVI